MKWTLLDIWHDLAMCQIILAERTIFGKVYIWNRSSYIQLSFKTHILQWSRERLIVETSFRIICLFCKAKDESINCLYHGFTLSLELTWESCNWRWQKLLSRKVSSLKSFFYKPRHAFVGAKKLPCSRGTNSYFPLLEVYERKIAALKSRARAIDHKGPHDLGAVLLLTSRQPKVSM